MSPDDILDRTDTCNMLGISRQTLIAWIRKGKIKVWKRVGHGSNAALLFEKSHVESLIGVKPVIEIIKGEQRIVAEEIMGITN